jgi:hypothetical protein
LLVQVGRELVATATERRIVLALLLSEANAILKLARQSGDGELIRLVAQVIDRARSLHYQPEADEANEPTGRVQ